MTIENRGRMRSHFWSFNKKRISSASKPTLDNISVLRKNLVGRCT